MKPIAIEGIYLDDQVIDTIKELQENNKDYQEDLDAAMDCLFQAQNDLEMEGERQYTSSLAALHFLKQRIKQLVPVAAEQRKGGEA